jgi:hypothetical protein
MAKSKRMWTVLAEKIWTQFGTMMKQRMTLEARDRPQEKQGVSNIFLLIFALNPNLFNTINDLPINTDQLIL